MGAPNFSDMLEQKVEKGTETGYLGDIVTDGEGLLRVWYSTDGGSFVQLIRANVLVLQQ